MPARRATMLFLIMAALAALGGCHWFKEHEQISNQSPLSPLLSGEGRAELEVFFVRLPSSDPKAAAELWKEVDEQPLSVEARRQLSRNGFRAGVIGSQTPPRITEALNSAVPRSPKESQRLVDDPESLGATRHQMFLHPGQRGELLTSGVLRQFQVLHWQDGQPQGTTFEDGQAQYVVTAEPLEDGRVRLQLTPEIHHGGYQQRYLPGEGTFRLDNSRKKKVLDDLRIDATLTPGESIVIGSRPDRPGSLASCFFRESDGAAARPRLLLMRLAPGRHDPQFAERSEEAGDGK